MSKLLVIIPAYNEEENIEKVVTNLITHYSMYDYIVVNDGSSDSTAEICKRNGYNLLDLPVNLGLSGAVQSGLKYAYENAYDYALQFDADGQHLPQYIPLLLTTMKNGYDIVIGSRFLNEKKSFSLRMLGHSVISFVIKLTTGRKLTDPTSGMRLYNRKMICEFAHNTNYDPEPDTIAYLIRNNISVTEVQVQMEERKFGQSLFSFTASLRYMMHIMVSILIVQWIRKREEHNELGA